MARIYNLSGKLNDDDRQTLAALLYKAGYKVWPGKEQLEGRKTNTLFTEFEPVGKEKNDGRWRRINYDSIWYVFGFSQRFIRFKGCKSSFAKADVTASVTQETTKFRDNLFTGTKGAGEALMSEGASATIDAAGLTAGEWNGIFNFAINLNQDVAQ